MINKTTDTLNTHKAMCIYKGHVHIKVMYCLHNNCPPPPTHTHSDVGKIHAGIGDKVALLLQWLATFVGGFVIGFVRDWRLTLVLLGFTPFLAIGGFIMTKVTAHDKVYSIHMYN